MATLDLEDFVILFREYKRMDIWGIYPVGFGFIKTLANLAFLASMPCLLMKRWMNFRIKMRSIRWSATVADVGESIKDLKKIPA